MHNQAIINVIAKLTGYKDEVLSITAGAEGGGVVLYRKVETNELICHRFDKQGSTYSGVYSGSGDDPVGEYLARTSSERAEGFRVVTGAVGSRKSS